MVGVGCSSGGCCRPGTAPAAALVRSSYVSSGGRTQRQHVAEPKRAARTWLMSCVSMIVRSCSSGGMAPGSKLLLWLVGGTLSLSKARRQVLQSQRGCPSARHKEPGKAVTVGLRGERAQQQGWCGAHGGPDLVERAG